MATSKGTQQGEKEMTIEFELRDSLTPGFKLFIITKKEKGSTMVEFAININPEEIQALVKEIFNSVTLEEYSRIVKEDKDG